MSKQKMKKKKEGRRRRATYWPAQEIKINK